MPLRMRCIHVQRQRSQAGSKRRLISLSHRIRHTLTERSRNTTDQPQYFSEPLRQTKQKFTPSAQHSAVALQIATKAKQQSLISKSALKVGKLWLIRVAALRAVRA